MADLEAIISNSLSEATGGDGDDATDVGTTGEETGETSETSAAATDTGESTTETVTEEATVDAAAKAEADAKAAALAEDAFASEHGLLDKAGKRENRMPYPRVKAIVQNAEKKLAQALFGDKLAADKPVVEQIKAHAARFGEIEQENQGLKTQLQEVDQVEQIMLQRPEQFLDLLPHINPRFAELLPGLKQAGKAQETPAPAELPKPDLKVTMPDGKEAMTYSVEGIVGLVKAVAAQTKAETLKDVDGKVKPFVDREAAAATDAQILDRLHARVNHARQNWDGFKDNEKDIQDTLRIDREQAMRTRTRPKLDLHDAYIVVMNKKHKEEREKLKVDREKMRGEIVKEINGRPRATAATAGASGKKVTSESTAPQSIEDVIKGEMDRAGIR